MTHNFTTLCMAKAIDKSPHRPLNYRRRRKRHKPQCRPHHLAPARVAPRPTFHANWNPNSDHLQLSWVFIWEFCWWWSFWIFAHVDVGELRLLLKCSVGRNLISLGFVIGGLHVDLWATCFTRVTFMLHLLDTCCVFRSYILRHCPCQRRL